MELIDIFKSDKMSENMILSKNIQVDITNYINKDNSNVLVIGSAGCGKNYHFIVPNVLNTDENFIIIDIAKEIYTNTENNLRTKGYDIGVIDFSSFENTLHFNPFLHISSIDDIENIVRIIMDGTEKVTDLFWDDTINLIYRFIFTYIWHTMNKEDMHFGTVNELIRNLGKNKKYLEMNINKIKEDLLTTIDEEDRKIKKYIIDCYSAIDLLSKKIFQSVIISIATQLDSFNITKVLSICKDDTLHNEDFKDKKKVLFINLPMGDRRYNFLANIIIYQLMNDRFKSNQRAMNQRKINFILNEFYLLGELHCLGENLSKLRSNNMHSYILIQSISQLKRLYPDTWDIILNNCGTILYMGGCDYDTKHFIDEQAGFKIKVPFSFKKQPEPIGQISKEVKNLKMEDCIVIIKDKKAIDKKYKA